MGFLLREDWFGYMSLAFIFVDGMGWDGIMEWLVSIFVFWDCGDDIVGGGIGLDEILVWIWYHWKQNYKERIKEILGVKHKDKSKQFYFFHFSLFVFAKLARFLSLRMVFMFFWYFHIWNYCLQVGLFGLLKGKAYC